MMTYFPRIGNEEGIYFPRIQTEAIKQMVAWEGCCGELCWSKGRGSHDLFGGARCTIKIPMGGMGGGWG